MSMQRCLPLCLLLLTVGLFAVEPTLRTALLPDAELIIATDKGFNQAPFVKGVKAKILDTVKTAFAASPELQQKAIAELQKDQHDDASLLFSLSIGPAMQNPENVDLQKIRYCLAIQWDKDMGLEFDARLQEELGKENAKVSFRKVAFRDGWRACEVASKDTPEFVSIVALTPDGKMLFLAPRALLEQQLDAPAELSPLVKQYFEKARRKGPCCSIAVLVSEPLLTAVKNKVDACTAAQQYDTLSKTMQAYNALQAFKAVAFSATGKEDCVILDADLHFYNATKAQEFQMTLSQNYLPMLPILGPSLLNGQNLPLFSSVKCATVDTHSCIEAKVTQADCDCLIQFLKAKLMAKAAEAATQAAPQN